jgi:hypothetical protein
MEAIKVKDIIEYTIGRIKWECFGGDMAAVELLETALNELDLACDEPDRREDTVRDYVGRDPYSWMVIPNFDVLEDFGIEEIVVDFEDGMVVSAPLLY